jgi:hypothetical protein
MLATAFHRAQPTQNSAQSTKFDAQTQVIAATAGWLWEVSGGWL